MKEKTSILGSNHQVTKLQNRALVLKLICTGTNVSRIDIARQTGLSKMSITNIVNELIDEGFVVNQVEQPEPSGNNSVGRKPVFLAPDTNTHAAIGLYIARDFAVAVISNLRCEIIAEKKCNFSFEETDASFAEKIKKLIASIVNSDAASGKTIIGIGVASIGPLDLENGVILQPTNFHKLNSIPIKKLLEDEFGYRVFINNDMNASAVAEKLFGKAKDVGNFVYIGVTNGIGAGIIADSSLFIGDMGFSGEIGHTTINFEGPKCPCGNIGCLELYASIPEIVSQARSSIDLGMESSLKELDVIEWKDIVSSALEGDTLSLNLIDRLCLYTSIGFVSIANIFDPKIIYLGHDIALAGKLVTDRLESYLRDKTISSKYKNISVEISAFIDRAPIFGSTAIIFDRLFNPT